MSPVDGVAAAAFVAVFAARQAAQAYWLRRRDRETVLAAGRGDLALAAAARNVLIAVTVVRLFRGVGHGPAFVAGWGLLLAGTGLRLVALAQLGRMYSLGTEVRRRHELVRHGLYAVVRHPLYAADIIGAAGMALLGQAAGMAVAVAVLAIAWVRAMAREDAVLSAVCGAAHREYVRTVPALDLVRGTVRLVRREMAAAREATVPAGCAWYEAPRRRLASCPAICKTDPRPTCTTGGGSPCGARDRRVAQSWRA